MKKEAPALTRGASAGASRFHVGEPAMGRDCPSRPLFKGLPRSNNPRPIHATVIHSSVKT